MDFINNQSSEDSDDSADEKKGAIARKSNVNQNASEDSTVDSPKFDNGRKKLAPSKKKRKNSCSDSDDDWKQSNSSKKIKKSGGGGGGRGFTRPLKLSPELSKLMGGAESLPRHEVVKKVWAIIKERNLYDPKNKQFAICDSDLQKVIGVKRFRTFGMMKYLQPHFTN